MNYEEITNENELNNYLHFLKEENIEVIAMDFEGEYNLHQYGETLCLIQIYDGKRLTIIDPLKFPKQSYSKIFENDNILKIMYDSTSDQSLIQKNFSFSIVSILDLRPAVELLNFDKKDLHSVIYKTLKIKLEKKNKFQMYNWTNRPLSEEAIKYALEDVLYLFDVKENIMKRLSEQKLMDKFLIANNKIQIKDYAKDAKPKHEKAKQYFSLNRQQKKIFKDIFELRDKYARQVNLPPHKVIPNHELLQIAKGRFNTRHIRFNKSIDSNLTKEIISQLNTFLS